MGNLKNETIFNEGCFMHFCTSSRPFAIFHPAEVQEVNFTNTCLLKYEEECVTNNPSSHLL